MSEGNWNLIRLGVAILAADAAGSAVIAAIAPPWAQGGWFMIVLPWLLIVQTAIYIVGILLLNDEEEED